MRAGVGAAGQVVPYNNTELSMCYPENALFYKRVDVCGQLIARGGMMVTSDERVNPSLVAALAPTRAVDRCMHGRKLCLE